MSESASELQSIHNPLPPQDVSAAMEQAISLVSDELAEVEHRLRELLQSTITIIPQVGGHLAFAGGKRFRPLVTALAARAAGYDDDARVTVAAVGELLHTATLLHDDVIDGGEFRRGRPAARLSYGNGMAVLTGDFCLARALQAMARVGDIGAVQTMSDAVTRMAEGEVAQLHVAGSFSLDRDTYYMVIDRKTAALISWCSSVAGLIDAPLDAALARYGLELGYAFQIADDVIDYAHGVDETGKARGQDLREGKMTLPLLLACDADDTLRTRVREALASGPPVEDAMTTEILARVTSSGALEEARTIALAHADRAIESLAALRPSPARTSLAALAHYVVRRCR